MVRTPLLLGCHRRYAPPLSLPTPAPPPFLRCRRRRRRLQEVPVRPAHRAVHAGPVGAGALQHRPPHHPGVVRTPGGGIPVWRGSAGSIAMTSRPVATTVGGWNLSFVCFFFRWGGADVGWDWVRQGMMGCCSRPRSRRVCLPGWGSSSARCDSVGRPLEASARGTRDASQALFPRVDQKARGERVRFVTLFSSQFTRPCTRDAKNKERGGRTHPHTTRQKRGKRKQ